MPYPGYPVSMDLPDARPFEILDLGNGQVFAFFTGGPEDVPKVIAFAHRSPALFKKFFPGVNVDDVISGRYQWFDESNAATQQASDAMVPATTTADIPAAENTDVTLAAAADAPSSTITPTPSVPLNMRHAMVAGVCHLHPTYGAAYARRLQKDRRAFFVFSPLRLTPADAHKLTGAAYASFLASQGLPPYVPPSRMRANFVPRKRPMKNSYQATKVTVKGGDFLWNLARDPTELELKLSTAGTSVIPTRGRVYTFEELFPEEEEEVSSLSEHTSTWGSSPTVASPWMSSSQDSALDFAGSA
ncbi:hypothetical protein GGG16DRAFT_66583 [Schizophyllum commune]